MNDVGTWKIISLVLASLLVGMLMGTLVTSNVRAAGRPKEITLTPVRFYGETGVSGDNVAAIRGITPYCDSLGNLLYFTKEGLAVASHGCQ